MKKRTDKEGRVFIECLETEFKLVLRSRSRVPVKESEGKSKFCAHCQPLALTVRFQIVLPIIKRDFINQKPNHFKRDWDFDWINVIDYTGLF